MRLRAEWPHRAADERASRDRTRAGLGPLQPIAAALALLLALGGVSRAQGTTVAETYREAYDAGYRDGGAAGERDRKEGKPYDLANRKEFQQADRGFDPARHEREVYLVAYRRGFEDGYEKGYGLSATEKTAGTPAHRSQSESPSAPRAAPSPPPPAASGASAPAPAALPVSGGVVAAGADIQIELLDSLGTRYSERGDPFRARVVQDVQVGGQRLVPRGSLVSGSVSYVKRAGRIRGRAQLNLRFEEIRLPDGRASLLEARLVGIESQSDEEIEKGEGTIVAASGRKGDTGKVATTSGVGALIGVIAGGGKGAGAGAAAGAVAGLANVLITRGRDIQLDSRTRLTIRLTQELRLSSNP